MKTTSGYYEQREGRHPDVAWIINYDVERALHNYHYMAAQMVNEGGHAWPRVFASRDCAAIVIANTGLEHIREPHVMAWRESFHELQRFEFLQRVEECLAGQRAWLGAEIRPFAA